MMDAPALGLGLGLDAGGSQTRWALADANGALVAQGHVAGMGGLQLQTEAGLANLRATLQALAHALGAVAPGQPLALYGGFTGLGSEQDKAAMRALLQAALPISASHIRLTHDMDIAYRAAFAPGAGYLVYGGTGSVAAFIDGNGQTHLAGGRGYLLGDDGGGYWIAHEALAWVWRQEDRSPGRWKQSPMARRLFEAVGGNEWSSTRAIVYSGDRGAIGRLALQVAASAQDDPVAHALLLRAGAALGELAQHMLHRFGPRPITAGGRALLLSPLLEQGLRKSLPSGTALTVTPELAAHVTAARLATNIGQINL
jgi:N-acetylglucosamine kinase-like BadF-type ATPase